MTQADIAAFSLVALAVLAAVVSLMTKVHTDLVPGIKTLMADVRDIRAIATDARQTAALAAQQGEQNSQRLTGQSAKIDAVVSQVTDVNNSILLATPPPVVEAPPPPVVPPPVAPPPVVFSTPDAPVYAVADAPTVVPDAPTPAPAVVPANPPQDAPIILAARAALDAHGVPHLGLDPDKADIIRAIQALVNAPTPAETPGTVQTVTARPLDPVNGLSGVAPVLVGAAPVIIAPPPVNA